jgi:hypothetical protein
VTITSGTMTVAQKTLASGESLFFNGRNDASSVHVTFMKGEALSESCPGYAGLIGGIQPVSDYIVHVVLPIGTSVTATHITDESAASPASTPSSLPGSAAVTTTPKSSLPFAGLCVLGLSIAVIAVQRRRD